MGEADLADQIDKVGAGEGRGPAARPRPPPLLPLVARIARLPALLVIPPLIYLVVTSFYTTTVRGVFNQFTYNYYIDLVDNPRVLRNLISTATYSVGAAIVAITIGITLAWIVERTNTPFRKWMI